MRAMVLRQPGAPLQLEERADPAPGAGEVRLRVAACAVCRTDLHVVDGELPQAKLPVVPGHEIVGTVEALGAGVQGLAVGDCVGVPWLAHTCGHCRYCAGGHENLCDAPLFTGYTRDGGFATHVVAEAAFCLPLTLTPQRDAEHTAPLLCAGLIGWRALRMAGDPRFAYRLLWEERQLVSVANLTRADGRDFLHAVATMPLHVETTAYPLERANEALADLRAGRLQGAAVLLP